jgi:plasmid maintenance system antidote protein VapI
MFKRRAECVDEGPQILRVNEIVRERRSIIDDIALRLALFSSTSHQFWLNLQSNCTHYALESACCTLYLMKDCRI